MAKLTKLYNFLQSISTIINSTEALDISLWKDENKIFISTCVDFNLIKPIGISKDDYCAEMVCDNGINKIILTLNIFDNELKLFYKDYKNYYYLPKEDIIVHKSLAAFVDKENKEKATASNCYTKHSGAFVKIPKDIGLPVFRVDYADKNLYALVSDGLFSSKKNLTDIFRTIIKHIIK